MAVPTAPNIPTTLVLNIIKGAFHPPVKAPSSTTFTPPYYNPVPVGEVLQNGTTGVSYSESITAQGGTSPYTFAVTSGSLPSGLTLASGGAISGTPTGTGTSTFTITDTDANGYQDSQVFQITIAAPSSGAASNYGYFC